MDPTFKLTENITHFTFILIVHVKKVLLGGDGGERGVKSNQYIVRGHQNSLLRPCCPDVPALILSSTVIITDQFEWWPNTAADAASPWPTVSAFLSACARMLWMFSVVLLLHTVSSSGMQESADQSGETSAVTSQRERERERERERTGASSLPIH